MRGSKKLSTVSCLKLFVCPSVLSVSVCLCLSVRPVCLSVSLSAYMYDLLSNYPSSQPSIEALLPSSTIYLYNNKFLTELTKSNFLFHIPNVCSPIINIVVVIIVGIFCFILIFSKYLLLDLRQIWFFALLGCSADHISSLPTFRESLSITCSRFKHYFANSSTMSRRWQSRIYWCFLWFLCFYCSM